jgi:hypothetical protein
MTISGIAIQYKGVSLSVAGDYTPADPDTGWRDDFELEAICVDEDADISVFLSPHERLEIERLASKVLRDKK